ncbi:hypothetical protein [Herbidospora sp. NBRC 101105]|uniref:hypothetical protein n=1 Tax=Herbidospora sp. NBRC 101105 TaxID=3032195 RepID=UPI00249FAF23|nr:hypothetical protein [Herbidospora sp. NBRC 101105]GLX93150.1 hypothetical protein Hesp01_11000 [Herbidospora sp. NBRC 101105]
MSHVDLGRGIDEGVDILNDLDSFFAGDGTEEVSSIRIGEWPEMYEESSEAIVEKLVANAHLLPGLRRLSIGDVDPDWCEISWIQLGVERYGGNTTAADLAPILAGDRLPALKHLGVQDSEIQDEIAAAVASAPVVAQLDELDLSMGTLTDAGAEALLGGQPLSHLKVLDLHHNFLSDTMADRVAKALPGVDVKLHDRFSPEDDRLYVAVSE